MLLASAELTVAERRALRGLARASNASDRRLQSCGSATFVADSSNCPSTDLQSCYDSVACGDLCEGDGECGTDNNLDNCDSYDVYRKDCGDMMSYIEVAKLTAADAASGDEFGISVAIDGGTVVLGARERESGGSKSGSAYIFRTTDGGATYVQAAKLTASDAGASDYFGYAVAIDGATVVVGAYGKNSETGAVYIFSTRDNGISYFEMAKLTASDAASGDRFGISVAIDGGTVVIGAYYDDDGGSKSGSAYVFRTNDGGATYIEIAKLTAADTASGDWFGESVAIEGNTIVVGARYDDDGGSSSGSVYVFLTSDVGATYDQVAKLTAADAASNDHFGVSVAIAGDSVVVGVYYKSNRGAAYVFRTDDGGATYAQVAKLTASDASSYDYFGRSVAIYGATVVIGAHQHERGPGSVYVFEMPAPTAQPTRLPTTALPTRWPTLSSQPTLQSTTLVPVVRPTPRPTPRPVPAPTPRLMPRPTSNDLSELSSSSRTGGNGTSGGGGGGGVELDAAAAGEIAALGAAAVLLAVFALYIYRNHEKAKRERTEAERLQTEHPVNEDCAGTSANAAPDAAPDVEWPIRTLI